MRHFQLLHPCVRFLLERPQPRLGLLTRALPARRSVHTSSQMPLPVQPVVFAPLAEHEVLLAERAARHNLVEQHDELVILKLLPPIECPRHSDKPLWRGKTGKAALRVAWANQSARENVPFRRVSWLNRHSKRFAGFSFLARTLCVHGARGSDIGGGRGR